MDNVYEELDEARAEIERLKQQFRSKLELAESLKRAHAEQLGKNKEVSSKVERLTQELCEKEDEISTARQQYEELKSNLAQKESIIKQLSSAHDKLRVDSSEKLSKCEVENKALALALDDANAKNIDQEEQICALKKEIDGAKRLVNVSEKKCTDENKTRVLGEVQGREDVCLKLEEENKKIKDQLKWKKEQFSHLEEAHKKLKDEFKKSEKEWEMEKSTLLDGISSLQANLESQTRISEDLQRRLEFCNHALAHAESKRKVLEAQLKESRTTFENVCVEYEAARLSFENLTSQRDQEIATLRSSQSTKEILYKEMEYQLKKLEQEKQELLALVKELQECQIREAGSSSSSKLQRKLRSLEEAHKGCSNNLKTKESEWRCEMEKLSEELSNCRMELKSRDSSLNELNRELEACDSLRLQLELVNQETSLVLLVLKSQLAEVKPGLADSHSCLDLKNKQMQEKITEIVEQLESKKAALDSVHNDLEDERERVAVLSKKVQALEELKLTLQKEGGRLKEKLQESTTCQLQSKEQVLQIQGDLERVQCALERANEELYEQFCEASEIEYELQEWKYTAEQLETNLKQNLQMRKEVEASLLAQMDVEVSLNLEKECLCHQLEEKERRIDHLQQQLNEVNESMKAIERSQISETEMLSEEAVLEQNGTEKDHKQEEEPLHQIVEEKDRRICDLQQLVSSLEQEFESSSTSFASRLSQMQEEMNNLRESWELVKAADILKEVEIQEKNIMITELENDLGNLRQRVEQQEKTILKSEKRTKEIQAALEEKELEVHTLECELTAKIVNSEKTIANLHKKCKNLSSENNSMMRTMSLLSNKMEHFSYEGTQLMECLGKIVETIDDNPKPEPVWSSDDSDGQDSVKENMDISSSPLVTKLEAIGNDRSPLRVLNS